MGSVRLSVGTEWLLDGRAFRVVRQPAPNCFIAKDAKFQIEQQFSKDEILSLYVRGRLRFAVGDTGVSTATESSSHGRTIHDLNEHQQHILQHRWQAIEPLTRASSPSQTDFQQRSEELRNEGTNVSPRTLRRWCTTWRAAGNDRLALLPATLRSGGRGQHRRHSWLERFPHLKRIAEEAIENVYLSKARRPVSAVVRRVLEDIQRLNARLPAAQALPVPREATLSRAIARRIAQLDPWEVDRTRWGRQIADRRHAPTSPQRMARRILERVEIDHTPLKVVVGTDAGPIGQPTLTVLIDYYSRMIVGFCLGFEPPSYPVLMEALRHAILPKGKLADRYPRVQGTWPCYGVPEKLVCDRGSDLTSKDLENAAFQLGVELDFNPPRTPHFKGTVESFFGGLNHQLSASLPGRTFRSWERRGDYNPDDGPLLPYDALLEIIHIHLIDVYSVSKHPTATKTRLEMWQESAAEFPPCLPAAPEELVVLLAKHAERTLLPRGIELGGMFYNSDELMALRAQLAANNIHEKRLQVRFNPWDLGQVWVLNPIDQRYLPATAVDEAMKGITQYQWNALKRAVRERFDRPDHLMSLASGRNAIRDAVNEALQRPSRKRRVRAARFAQPAPPELCAGNGDDATEQRPFSNGDDVGNTSHTPEQPEIESQLVADNDSELLDVDVDDWDIAVPGD